MNLLTTFFVVDMVLHMCGNERAMRISCIAKMKYTRNVDRQSISQLYLWIFHSRASVHELFYVLSRPSQFVGIGGR